MGGLLHLVQWGGVWAGCSPAQFPHCCTKCNSPPINGQCTNFILFDMALQMPPNSKRLKHCRHWVLATYRASLLNSRKESKVVVYKKKLCRGFSEQESSTKRKSGSCCRPNNARTLDDSERVLETAANCLRKSTWLSFWTSDDVKPALAPAYYGRVITWSADIMFCQCFCFICYF